MPQLLQHLEAYRSTPETRMFDLKILIAWLKPEIVATWQAASVIDRIVGSLALIFLASSILRFDLLWIFADAAIVAYVWHTVRDRAING